MEAERESQLTAVQALVRGRRREGSAVWVALPLLVGLALRLWMLKEFFEVQGDSLVYGGIAKNLLLHGRYALIQPSGAMMPTIIRLPGYPLFLVACFKVFGMENYASAAWVQIALELAGGLLLADFARRVAPEKLGRWDGLRRGAAHCTLWLAMLCPFTAIYDVAPMSEGLTLFLVALALRSAARFRERAIWASALWFTFAVTYAALLRPDGALLAVALAPALAVGLWRADAAERKQRMRMGLVCVLVALAPFAVWTGRNWRVFHVFEPLAPHYATEPGEDMHLGWKLWFKTWSLDFVSTFAVSWQVPDNELDLSAVPARAFDSPRQYAETAALAAEYNRNEQEMTPALDAGFARLAKERIAADPLRFYVWLPLGRMADMWLRPRVENLPVDLDWWVYANHPDETRLSWAYLVLNLVYLALAGAGLWLRPRLGRAMLAYFLLRSALLLTVGAPEARYTIECFPMIFALAGIALYCVFRKSMTFWERCKVTARYTPTTKTCRWGPRPWWSRRLG